MEILKVCTADDESLGSSLQIIPGSGQALFVPVVQNLWKSTGANKPCNNILLLSCTGSSFSLPCRSISKTRAWSRCQVHIYASKLWQSVHTRLRSIQQDVFYVLSHLQSSFLGLFIVLNTCETQHFHYRTPGPKARCRNVPVFLPWHYILLFEN